MLAATRTVTVDYEGLGLWTGDTLGSLLADAVGTRPDATAVVDGSVRLTYRDLGIAVDRMAGRLAALGVRRGDVVTAQLPNWWETVALFQAVARLGAVINPVVSIYREAELSFILAEARPRVVVVPERFRGHDHLSMVRGVVSALPDADRPTVVVARPGSEGQVDLDPTGVDGGDGGPERAAPGAGRDPVGSPDDLVLLLYTSGTTAAPKGVLHSHRTLVCECRSIAELFGLEKGSSVFMPSPLTHITGLLYGVVLPPMLQSACVLMDVWDPDAARDLVERHGCEFSVAATPFLAGLTAAYERQGTPARLRHFGCGGADVPPELVRRATKVLEANVVRLYGSSEMPTFSGGRPDDDVDAKSATDGHPIGAADGRLADPVGGVGELEVRGPELFLGYLDPQLNDASFTPDGYFRTGDLASFDQAGCVTIEGRVKDIIIRKGEKISAREVEDMLYQHPDVAEVTVVAVPDPESGERACAVVVPVAPARPTLGELCAFLATFNVAKQKHPESLELVDELPRNAAGKVQKYVIRQRLAEGGRG